MNSSPKKMIQLRQHEVTIPTSDGLKVADRIKVRVPMEWDQELGQWLLSPEAESILETAKARHMGLLLPHELLDLRQRLNLSQQMIGELLQIGAKTWTRWETGRQRPSRSMNLLLKMLYAGLVSSRQLLELGGARHDWSAQFEFRASGSRAADSIALDVCRGRAAAGQNAAPVPFEPLQLPA